MNKESIFAGVPVLGNTTRTVIKVKYELGNNWEYVVINQDGRSWISPF